MSIRQATGNDVRLGADVTGRLLPWALLSAVLLDDWVIGSADWPVPMLGPLDWIGHVATSLLGIGALALRRSMLLGVAVLSSVAIDIDHVGLYLGWYPGVDGGRPFTHSLTTPAILLLAALALPRARKVLLGASVGVTLHLVRDLATGPGIPMFAPWSERNVLVPYAWYASALALAALLMTRGRRTGRSRTGRY